MLRIKQARLSRSVSSFDFPGAYGLGEYTDPMKPCIFFGMYAHSTKPYDYKALMFHRGLAVVVWCGSDALLMPGGYFSKIKRRPNIKHIAIGGFIERDLKRIGIDCVRIPLTPTQPKPDPQPLGRSIYCYLPDANKHQREFYGGRYIDDLKKRLPKEKFILTKPHKYSQTQLKELYKQSYIGLRLTKHDGLSNTVMELGAMGRMCLYNDDVPNAIPWKNTEDIIRAIQREKKLRGQTKTDIANAVGNFLDVSDDWLYTKFWE